MAQVWTRQMLTISKSDHHTVGNPFEYFCYDGVFHKQKKGAAMGSPVSPIRHNLYNMYVWITMKKEPSEKHLTHQTPG